jgi:hypothetical protein
MAVNILNDFDESKVYSCFQNLIVRFNSTNSGSVSHAKILNFENDITLQPIPGNNTFWIDLQKHIKNDLVTDNLIDGDSLAVDETDVETFILNKSNSFFFQKDIKFQVVFDDNSIDERIINLKAFKGVKNLFLFENDIKTYDVAHPFQVIYWKGLPFTITVIGERDDFHINNSLDDVDSTNSILIEPNQVGLKSAYRITIDDGRFALKPTPVTGNDLINSSITSLYADTGQVNPPKIVEVHRITNYCFGKYFKWFNQKGGWSYFLFSENHQRLSESKNIGSLYNDFENYSENSSPILQIGKESTQIMTVVARKTTYLDRKILADIIDSPKIYLFTGQPNTQTTSKDWIEVELITDEFQHQKFNVKKWDIELEFKIPKHYTQKI